MNGLCIWLLVGGMFLLSLACPPGGSARGEGKATETDAGGESYQKAVREKVGEVAEIRLKELVESRANPDDANGALFRLGLYRYFLGDFAGSEFYMRKLVKRAEGSTLAGEARLWIGRTYLERGDVRSAMVELQEGLTRLERAGKRGGELAGRYDFWIAEAYRQEGKRTEARTQYDKLAREHPQHPLSVVLQERLADMRRPPGTPPPSGAAAEVRPVDTAVAPTAQDMPVGAPAQEYQVQIGSFSVRKNAQDLVDALRDLNLRGVIRTADLETGRYYRVVVEGFSSREEAEQAAERVRKGGYGQAIVEERK
jgi:tetratricopeptide (TPR) repeat protein